MFNFSKKAAVISQASFSTIFAKSKKGIGPVVATALLLVVAVGSFAILNGWFQSYQSDFMSSLEIQSNSGYGSLSIEGIFGDKLSIMNKIQDNLSITLIKIGDVECNLTGQNNLSLGITIINVSSCVNSSTSQVSNVVLLTKSKIVDKTVLLHGQNSGGSTPANCTALDGIQLNNAQSYSFFNSSFGSTCYSSSRTCSDGVIGGNSSYNLSSCIVSTSLSCATDIDGDGDINSSCAVYPMTNTTFEGYLDVNDLNGTISSVTINESCLFNNDKSGCLDQYVINGCGTGTVLDIGTNLCWQQNMSSFYDFNGSSINWTDAKSYCTGLSLAGHTDWYLPSRQEFESIVDLTRTSLPHIVGGNTIFTNVQSSYYWTKTTYGHSTTAAFYVTLNLGISNGYAKTYSHYVACLRRD